jgi:hypothetical protein
MKKVNVFIGICSHYNSADEFLYLLTITIDILSIIEFKRFLWYFHKFLAAKNVLF